MRIHSGKAVFVVTEQTTLFSLLEFLRLVHRAEPTIYRLVFDAYFNGVLALDIGE